MNKNKKIWSLLLILAIFVLVTIYLDGINVLTKIKPSVRRTFSIYNINIWQLTSFYGVLIASLSFAWAVYTGINNLNEIKNNDYQRTKARLLMELKQIGDRKILVLRNIGDTSALIKEVKWNPELIRADMLPKGQEEYFLNYDKKLFYSKINKNIYPHEEIKYYLTGNECNIYEKFKKNKEFTVEIKWKDYKGKSNTYEYTLDFTNESIEIGISNTDSKDIDKKLEKMQENIVFAIKEHAFETKRR